MKEIRLKDNPDGTALSKQDIVDLYIMLEKHGMFDLAEKVWKLYDLDQVRPHDING